MGGFFNNRESDPDVVGDAIFGSSTDLFIGHLVQVFYLLFTVPFGWFLAELIHDLVPISIEVKKFHSFENDFSLGHGLEWVVCHNTSWNSFSAST